MPLRGVYIPHFDQILVKISVLGVLYPNRYTDGEKFSMEDPPPWRSPPLCQISALSLQRVAPVGRKTSKLASE